MSTTTENLGLTKPELDENFQLSVWNGNTDILDEFAGQVNTALAGKQEELTTAQMAAANSGITASKLTADEGALTAMVESGAKNFLVLTDTTTSTKKGVTLTYNNDGTYTVDSAGEASTGADYFYLARSASNPLFPKGTVLTGCTGGADNTYYIGIAGTSVKQTNAAVTLNADTSGSVIFSFSSGVTFDNLVIRPMVCSSADWALSQEFKPYCPTLAELYQMVLEMGGSRSVQAAPAGEEER